MEPYPLSKLNASGLSARKWTKLLMMMLQGRVEGSCLSHSMTMCSWVWTSALPQGQLVGRYGKNLCLYSPMGVWPVVMQVKRAHRELVKPMTGSHEPPLGWFDDFLFFVFEFQEVMTFFEAFSEVRLPFVKDVVAFFLSAE